MGKNIKKKSITKEQTRVNENQVFPSRVLIKVIFHARNTEADARRMITAALVPLGQIPSGFSSRLSRQGRWMSVSFFCEIPARETLDLVYDELKKLPDVRMLL